MKTATVRELNESMMNQKRKYHIFMDEDSLGYYDYCNNFKWDNYFMVKSYEKCFGIEDAQVFVSGDPRLDIIKELFPHLMLVEVQATYNLKISEVNEWNLKI